LAQFTFNLLGTFEVIYDGVLISSFESDKVRALLAYLAHEHDRTHRRDTLAGLFWPESDQRRARQNLSQALYNLRRTLGEHTRLLSSTGQEICLHVNDLVWLDTLEFHKGYQACQTHPHERIEFCTTCQVELERIAGLYRAEMLAGLYLDGCEAFEHWLGSLRSYYHNQVGRVWEWLAAGAELRHNDEAGIEACQNLLHLDPYNEDVLRRLMRLLARSIGRNEALLVYIDFRKFLHQEMGLPPEVETTRLYESLRDGEEHPNPPSNLPVPLDVLIGREEEMNLLFLRLVDPQHRLITLLGPGGVGKTHLALEAARAMRSVFPDGVFLIEVSGISGPDALLPEIARAVNFLPKRESASPQTVSTFQKDFIEQFFTFLHDQDTLLVLDSFETLLPAAPILTNLLAHAPQLHVLVTSRTRLNLKDEVVISLEGLSLHPDLTHTASSPAVRLFENTARKSMAGYQMEAVNLPVISRICQAVEGMPLGILLAASWISLIGPHEIERQIQSDLDFLSDGWHDMPLHQRSLRATYEYSWSFLNPQQRQALSRLAVFRQSFTAHKAQQICQVTLPMLKSLHDHSLLQARADGRYRLHDLLHSFSREKLQEDAEEWYGMQECLSQHYLVALHSWGEAMKTDRLDDAVVEMDLEIENTRQGWDWALQCRNWDGLQKGLYGLNRYNLIRSRWSDATHILQQASQKINEAGLSQANFRLWFEVRWRLILDDQEAPNEAKHAALESLARELDAPTWADLDLLRERAVINHKLAQIWIQIDDPKAEPYLLKSLALFRLLGNHYDLADVLHDAGILYTWMGRLDHSLQMLEEALTLCGEQCDPFRVNAITHWLGLTTLIAGRVERGKQMIERKRQLIQRHPILQSSSVPMEVGNLLMWCGEYQAASDLYWEFVEFNKLNQRPVEEQKAIAVYLEIVLGQYEQAQEHLAIDNLVDKFWRQFWLINQSMLHWRRLEYPEMLTKMTTAYNLSLEIMEITLKSMITAIAGYASYRLEEMESACRYLLEGLGFVRQTGNIAARNFVLGTLALLLAETGNLEASLAVWAAIADHPTLKNSIWHADVLYKPLSALTASLTEDSRQAARNLGRVLTIQEIESRLEACLQATPDLQEGLRCFAAGLI
jgi:DNA-binding SARP family transcriptional activator/predicted ATPase